MYLCPRDTTIAVREISLDDTDSHRTDESVPTLVIVLLAVASSQAMGLLHTRSRGDKWTAINNCPSLSSFSHMQISICFSLSSADMATGGLFVCEDGINSSLEVDDIQCLVFLFLCITSNCLITLTVIPLLDAHLIPVPIRQTLASSHTHTDSRFRWIEWQTFLVLRHSGSPLFHAHVIVIRKNFSHSNE